MIDSENLCRKAMEVYGFPAQAAMVVEECSELTNAICKFRRGRVGNDDIITEIADVMIMCEQLSSAGQAHFSHKQLEGLNSNQIQELLFQEKGINWNDYPTKFKRGSCCIKKYHQTMNQTLRSYWFIDNEIPIFKGEDREYIEKLIA